jgi:predicted flap endonuclease-1-like 5' DNA nuclease
MILLRPLNSLDELVWIKGIGPVRLEDIKSQGVACTGS